MRIKIFMFIYVKNNFYLFKDKFLINSLKKI